jgi:hypothetical protein
MLNPKVHFHVHKNPPLVPVLSQMNSVHSFPHYFPKIHSKIDLSSTPRYSAWCLSCRFSDQNYVCISPMRATFPAHLTLLDFITRSLQELQVLYSDWFLFYVELVLRSRVSSVVYRWATGWMTGVRVPVEAENFSLHHRVQTSSRIHPASYPMSTGGSFPGGKAAGA